MYCIFQGALELCKLLFKGLTTSTYRLDIDKLTLLFMQRFKLLTSLNSLLINCKELERRVLCSFSCCLYPSVGAGALVWCRACPQANMASDCSRVDRTDGPAPLGTHKYLPKFVKISKGI